MSTTRTVYPLPYQHTADHAHRTRAFNLWSFALNAGCLYLLVTYLISKLYYFWFQ